MFFTDDNFEKEVLQSSIPVMIDFYAGWCGPCKMMSPVVEQLAQEYEGRIKIGQVNVDDYPSLASRYNVMSIPNFVFIKDGQLADQAIGGMPKASLQAKLEALL